MAGAVTIVVTPDMEKSIRPPRVTLDDGLVCCVRCRYVHEAARYHYCKRSKITRSQSRSADRVIL